jgi:hypothetical protein
MSWCRVLSSSLIIDFYFLLKFIEASAGSINIICDTISAITKFGAFVLVDGMVGQQ